MAVTLDGVVQQECNVIELAEGHGSGSTGVGNDTQPRLFGFGQMLERGLHEPMRRGEG